MVPSPLIRFGPEFFRILLYHVVCDVFMGSSWTIYRVEECILLLSVVFDQSIYESMTYLYRFILWIEVALSIHLWTDDVSLSVQQSYVNSKILVCPEIRTPNLRITRPTLNHCTTAAHVKCIAYTCIYSVAYSIS